jgi:hypothetical protein
MGRRLSDSFGVLHRFISLLHLSGNKEDAVVARNQIAGQRRRARTS